MAEVIVMGTDASPSHYLLFTLGEVSCVEALKHFSEVVYWQGAWASY